MHRTGRICRACRGSLATAAAPILFLAAATMVVAQMPGQKIPGHSPAQVEQTSHGMHVTVGKETLEVTVCTDSVIHVVATPEPSASASPRPWMLPAQQSCPGVPVEFSRDQKNAVMNTTQLRVAFNLQHGNLSFQTTAGDSLLKEGNSVPRTYEPVQLNGEVRTG